MKRIFALLLLTLIAGCGDKKHGSQSEGTFFKGLTFNASGVSKDPVQLGVKLLLNGDGEKAYYLTVQTMKTEKNSTKLLCTFEAEDLPLARDIIALGREGLTVVLKNSDFKDSAHPDKKFQNIFLSARTVEVLNSKTSAQLIEDSGTLVMARDLDANNDESKETLCEFNLLAQSDINAAPSTALPLGHPASKARSNNLRNLMSK